MWNIRNSRCMLSMQVAGRHEEGKNVSSKELQIETYPDNATDNILK